MLLGVSYLGHDIVHRESWHFGVHRGTPTPVVVPFVVRSFLRQVFATVDRVRGHSSEEDFTKTFFPVKINMGIAPSEGLYLERPLYEPHNNQ